MRGTDHQTSQMFSYLSPEQMVPQDHPLRVIRPLANAALDRLSPASASSIRRSGGPRSRRSKLLRALLLQAFFSVRSERQLMEQIELQSAVPLVRRAADGRAGVGCDGVHQEPRPAAGGRHRRGFLEALLARPAGQGAAVGRALLGRRHADRGLGVDEELPAQGWQRRAAGAGPQRRARLPRREALQRDACLDHRSRRRLYSKAARAGERSCASWGMC